jgi:hypothetical protein
MAQLKFSSRMSFLRRERAADCALCLPLFSAGNSNAARMAMIAMTHQQLNKGEAGLAGAAF